MEDKTKNKIEFDDGWIFVFVDETGDPGHPSDTSASRYYQLNIAVTHRDSLKHLHKHLAAFRYFKESGKELKKHTRDSKILGQVFQDLAIKNNISFYSFILNKESYTGPYLKKLGKEEYQYNSKKFRNFIIRMSLEHVFRELVTVDGERNNIELVFDRYLESDDDETNLKQYLRGNYNLPHFERIVQVDSEYSDAVQVSDYIGRYVKEFCFDGQDNMVTPVFDFIRIFVLEDPDRITEKRPDTP
jgi:hypothetical protein